MCVFYVAKLPACTNDVEAIRTYYAEFSSLGHSACSVLLGMAELGRIVDGPAVQLHPWMRQSVMYSEAELRQRVHRAFHKVFGILADFVPLRSVEVVHRQLIGLDDILDGISHKGLVPT
jgi:hypothetical protein